MSDSIIVWPRFLKNEKILRFSKKGPRDIPFLSQGKVRLLVFSDWRVQDLNDAILFLKKIEPVDFVVYGGDDIVRFKENDGDYFPRLASLTKTGMALSVIGNDDFYTNSKMILKEEGVCDLYDCSIIYGDYAFIGLESSTSGPAIFRHTESDFRNQLRSQKGKLEGKKIIVVSHTPPFGILDLGIRFAPKDEGVSHIGSKALLKFIEKKDTQLVICGHSHSNGGFSEKYNNTLVVNAASHDNKSAVGKMAIIEINNRNIEVEWHTTLEVLGVNSVQHIHGIGPVYAKMLKFAGIETIQQLSEVEQLEEISASSKLSMNYLRKFQLKAKAMLKKETYRIRPFEIQNERIIYIDIETNIACERVWLIGIEVNGHFEQLYADTWDKEREILMRFLTILKDNPGYSLVSFSGTNFDYRVPLKALRRHGLDADYFERYFHIDLCNTMKNCFIFPNQSFALKNIGVHLEYPFKHDDIDGLMVAMAYHNHIKTGKPLDKKYLEYNEDDVRVLPFLLEKCRILNEKLKLSI